MDFERRIQRLTERHEALTQTVEIIALDMKKTEELMQKNETMMQKNQVMLAGLMDSINKLAPVAGIHQDRLDSHERRIQKLDEGRA